MHPQAAATKVEHLENKYRLLGNQKLISYQKETSVGRLSGTIFIADDYANDLIDDNGIM